MADEHSYAVVLNTINTTTHNWTMPSGGGSKRSLLVIVCIDGTPTVTFDGFAKIAEHANAGHTLQVWHKFTDGSETSGTFTTNVAERSVVYSLLYYRADPFLRPEIEFFSEASGSGDPPSISPSWGHHLTQFVVVVCVSDSIDESVSWTDIANYTTLDNQDTGGSTGDIQSKIWYRDLTTNSEDPGAMDFDQGSGVAYIAATIAVRIAPKKALIKRS
jgi:hypothetical protein